MYQTGEHEAQKGALRRQMEDTLPAFMRQAPEAPYELRGAEITMRALSALMVRMGDCDGCRFIAEAGSNGGTRRIVGVQLTARGLRALHTRCVVMRVRALALVLLEPAPRDGLADDFIALTRVQWLLETALGMGLPAEARTRMF